MLSFIFKKNPEKLAEKLAAKLLSLDKYIPEKILAKIKKEDFEVLDLLIKKDFFSLNPIVRMEFKKILEEIGYLDYLLKKLTSGTEEEIIEALEILGILRIEKTLPFIVKSLEDKRASINLEASRTLIRFQDMRVVNYLIDELIDEKSKIMPARIGHILIGLAPHSIPKLIEVFFSLPAKTKFQVVEIFAEVKDKRTVPILKEILLKEDSSPPLRALAAQTLGSIGDEDSQKYLLKALNDREIVVRENVKIALEEIAAQKG